MERIAAKFRVSEEELASACETGTEDGNDENPSTSIATTSGYLSPTEDRPDPPQDQRGQAADNQ
jgi:hypothetical protein